MTITKAKVPLGDRGKAAEKTVEAVLKRWNGRGDFAYWRLPDARSARNFLAAQPGDFAYFNKPRAGIIEVKETQHSYRIAKDKISQLATLKKLDLAGASSVILIHHSVEDVWRAVLPYDLDSSVPSWDLRDFPTFATAEVALISTDFFS